MSTARVYPPSCRHRKHNNPKKKRLRLLMSSCSSRHVSCSFFNRRQHRSTRLLRFFVIVVHLNGTRRTVTNVILPPPVLLRATALDVPGKIVLDPETLAAQQKGLEKIAQQLRRERLDKEAEDAITFGFCPRAELWNGR